jgi:hypothetical protein
VQEADRLCLMSEERGWRPERLDSERYVALLSEPEVVQVRIEYETLSDLVADVPRLSGMLRSLGAPQSAEGGEPDSFWARDALLERHGGRLDAYFAKCGCSQEDSLLLTVEVLHRLYQGGPVPDEELSLRELLWAAYRNRYGEPPSVHRRPARPRQRAYPDWGSPLEEAQAFEEGRLRSALSRFDRPVLRTLYLWLDSEYDEVQLSVVRRISPARISLWLDLVARRLRLSRGQLADPRLRQAVRERLGLPPTKQSDR